MLRTELEPQAALVVLEAGSRAIATASMDEEVRDREAPLEPEATRWKLGSHRAQEKVSLIELYNDIARMPHHPFKAFLQVDLQPRQNVGQTKQDLPILRLQIHPPLNNRHAKISQAFLGAFKLVYGS